MTGRKDLKSGKLKGERKQEKGEKGIRDSSTRDAAGVVGREEYSVRRKEYLVWAKRVPVWAKRVPVWAKKVPVWERSSGKNQILVFMATGFYGGSIGLKSISYMF